MRDVEELFRPVCRERDASRFLCCVADANLVIDIAVRDRHVGQHEVSEIESRDHLGNDQRARVLIRAHRVMAERLDGRRKHFVPKRVEIDLPGALLLGSTCVAFRP